MTTTAYMLSANNNDNVNKKFHRLNKTSKNCDSIKEQHRQMCAKCLPSADTQKRRRLNTTNDGLIDYVALK